MQQAASRAAAIGTAQTESLAELVLSSLIEPQMAMKISCRFDSSIAEALETKVKIKKARSAAIQNILAK